LNAGALLQLAEPDWLKWSHDNGLYPWMSGSSLLYKLKS